MDREVEFLPLLKAMPGQMTSVRLLREYGVTDDMIQAAVSRGEVVVDRSGSPFASVWLTEVGEALCPGGE